MLRTLGVLYCVRRPDIFWSHHTPKARNTLIQLLAIKKTFTRLNQSQKTPNCPLCFRVCQHFHQKLIFIRQIMWDNRLTFFTLISTYHFSYWFVVFTQQYAFYEYLNNKPELQEVKKYHATFWLHHKSNSDIWTGSISTKMQLIMSILLQHIASQQNNHCHIWWNLFQTSLPRGQCCLQTWTLQTTVTNTIYHPHVYSHQATDWAHLFHTTPKTYIWTPNSTNAWNKCSLFISLLQQAFCSHVAILGFDFLFVYLAHVSLHFAFGKFFAHRLTFCLSLTLIRIRIFRLVCLCCLINILNKFAHVSGLCIANCFTISMKGKVENHYGSSKKVRVRTTVVFGWVWC